MTHSVSTCLAELVAHLGYYPSTRFLIWTGLVTHSGLLGLFELVAELVARLGGFFSRGEFYELGPSW